MQQYMIKTKRLGLRLLQKNDLDHLVELNSDPDVRFFFPNGVQNREETETRMHEFISFYEEYALPNFMIFDLESSEFVGRAGFGPLDNEIEVGYVLHKKFWGKGLASETLTALLQYAEENLDTEFIIAYAPETHSASQRVMQKCGMKFFKNALVQGISCNFYRYHLIKKE